MISTTLIWAEMIIQCIILYEIILIQMDIGPRAFEFPAQ